MQTLIKEYGESILAAVVTVLIIGLIFGGLTLFGMLGVITGRIETPLVQDVEASSETALKRHMDIPADNIDMSGEVSVICGKEIFYTEEGNELIRLHNGSAKQIHISHVYLLDDGEVDTEGYDVTDQVLSVKDECLRFLIPGNYRLIVSVTDTGDVVSDYQIFVTAVERRNA